MMMMEITRGSTINNLQRRVSRLTLGSNWSNPRNPKDSLLWHLLNDHLESFDGKMTFKSSSFGFRVAGFADSNQTGRTNQPQTVKCVGLDSN
jgi:hypothetical protein